MRIHGLKRSPLFIPGLMLVSATIILPPILVILGMLL